jgi:hypothetical protein
MTGLFESIYTDCGTIFTITRGRYGNLGTR